MKKTFKTMLALMAGAMTFTGCTSDILENTPEQIPSALKPMTFTATQEGDATRAAIVGTAINWTEGDKISIFDGGEADEDGNLAREFTLTDGAGSTSGTFDGTAKEGAEAYYALYPSVESVYKETEEKREVTDEDLNYNYYNFFKNNRGQLSDLKEKYKDAPEDDLLSQLEYMWGYESLSAEDQAIVVAYIKGEEAVFKKTTKSGVQRDGDNFTNVVLPSEQTVAEGQYVDPKAMLMIGTSDENNIQFKNVCAYLKVKPTFACSSIVFKSNGTESLAGTVTLDYNEGNPTTTATNGTNTVTLSGTIAANSTYYIAVLPARLTTGFTIEFKDASDKVIGSKSTAKDVTFARNKVINLGSFDALPTPPEGSVGTATRTGDVEVNWVQLWENGPKFAEYNVGVTDGKAESLGGYYFWGKSVDQDPDCVYKDGSDVLSGTDDTATNLWGSKWRMPTNAELTALLDNCICTWDDTNKGFLCTGKGDYATNSIFLPAAGYCYGDVSGKGDNGCYWSSTPDDSYYASYLYYSSGSQYVDYYYRNYGFSVRAVLKEAPATKGTAMAIITQEEIPIDWIQLWSGGPKFANDPDRFSFVGAFNSPEAAIKNGVFEWGANWRTPSKDELNELLLAAQGNSNAKVSYAWGQVDGKWGFIFTGKEEGYTENSKFFPGGEDEDMGCLSCWSSDGGYMDVIYVEDGIGAAGWIPKNSYEGDTPPCIYAVLAE